MFLFVFVITFLHPFENNKNTKYKNIILSVPIALQFGMSFTTPCILEPKQYGFLYSSSWITLFTSLFGLYRQFYLDACFPFAVFLTSINYWRHPDYSWRRYLDMATVKCSLFYQGYYSYRSKYQNYYYFYTVVAILCYKISIYYHHKDNWKSTYFHSLVHVFANASIVVLFAGMENSNSVMH